MKCGQVEITVRFCSLLLIFLGAGGGGGGGRRSDFDEHASTRLSAELKRYCFNYSCDLNYIMCIENTFGKEVAVHFISDTAISQDLINLA